MTNDAMTKARIRRAAVLRRWSLVIASLVIGALVICTAAAQEEEEERPQYRRGLIAEYVGRDGVPRRRVDELLAFSWSGQRPDARLADGEFSVRWRGRLFSMAPGGYSLHVFAAGAVKISLEKQVLLDARTEQPTWLACKPIRLTYGHHPLEIDYRKAGKSARFALFWQGPKFDLEPVPAWHLFHDPPGPGKTEPPLPPLGKGGKRPPPLTEGGMGLFEHGQQLVRALRCAACHRLPEGELPAPALTHLAGNVSRAWLVDWIQHAGHPSVDARRASVPRMPAFGLSGDEAQAIAEYLLSNSLAEKATSATVQPRRNPVAEKPGQPDAQRGRELFLTLGCLACHQLDGLGSDGLFGGGDLSQSAAKRPADFFARWLADPAKVNPDHRMPVFSLEEQERRDLALFLATLGKTPATRPKAADPPLEEQARTQRAARGRELIVRYRCHACHRVPGEFAALGENDRKQLSADVRWSASCLDNPDARTARPGYQLPEALQTAVREYVSTVKAPWDGTNPTAASKQRTLDGRQMILERNCLGCHARGNSSGISALAEAIVAKNPPFAPSLSAMKPPALHGVGDKLHEQAMIDAILTKHAPLRPWLKIRMPRFDLSREEMAAVVKLFVETDRIPPQTNALAAGSRLNEKRTLGAKGPADSARHDPVAYLAAGRRLVTSAGFGCTSCHQIGKAQAEKDEVRSRGPDLAMLGRRVRREWYDRFMPNPNRIVPNMEMPALVLPARGLLNEEVREQLAAVWQVLNEPDFSPPLPGAVRIVRCRNVPGGAERANVLTDVLEVGGKTFVKPLLIGLPNRHNVLFDLETGSLAGWWIGNTAAQRTRGKSWYWEPAGTPVFSPEQSDSELKRYASLTKRLIPPPRKQFLIEVDSFEHVAGGVRFKYRLRLDAESRRDPLIRITQTITAYDSASGKPATMPVTGFLRRIEIERGRLEFDFRLIPPSVAKDPPVWRLRFDDDYLTPKQVAPTDRFQLEVKSQGINWPGPVAFEVAYLTKLPVDSFPDPPAVPSAPPIQKVDVLPGYDTVRLPLPDDIMPTGLAWREDGTLVFSSLKGQVWLAKDADGDGLEDKLTPFADGLAAPYGVAAHEGAIDVINKYALLRLHDDDKDGRADRTVTLASGWGQTSDYHDWAVGLEKDTRGNYYIALPCQQDDRSQAAAHLRGKALKLVPREPTKDDPRRYAIEEICGGLRFPMGLALSRDGELFATDNQGNYNPFNELNHLARGAHFGFINRVELRPGSAGASPSPPPLRPPAIDIPHSWTRSVNGIAFLYTPAAVRQKLGRDLFGPFEGHLLGCEYDTRRLIRMSLQKVGETYQGAAYPFSIDPPRDRATLQGPVVCAVAPDGDLYVGNMRDSGWGGGANVGSIVRLRPSGKLPIGIAEVRAAADGFTIDFTGPVDPRLASSAPNYAISSYRRVSTPAYGAKDQDRETATIRAIEVSSDARRVILRMDKMRPGFLYEFQVKSLTTSGELFHPDEAYYTLRRVPTP